MHLLFSGRQLQGLLFNKPTATVIYSFNGSNTIQRMAGLSRNSSRCACSSGDGGYRKTLPSHGEFSHAIEVKKSKFLAIAWHITSEKEALGLMDAAKDMSASHNCFALKCGPQLVRFSDDGEPSGTAGRPILNVIESMNLDQVCILVTRYFGGTKLGTGGLARAYGGAAKELISCCPLEDLIPYETVCVRVPNDLIGVAFNVVESLCGGKNVQEEFDDKENCFVLRFDVEQERQHDALNKLQEASKGKIIKI